MKNNLLRIFLFLSVSLNAQQVQYSWHNYTTNDGLPSPEVYTVIQDSKGFLWFGTDNGVSRFDGYTFQNFGAKEGLMDNVINGIQEDASGRIWFSSMWGKLYFFEHDTIRPFKYNQLIEAYQKAFSVSAGFFRFENGKNTEGGVFVGLTNIGILKILDNGHSELIAAPQAPALIIFEASKKDITVYQSCIKGVPQHNSLLRPIYRFDGQKMIANGTIRLTSWSDNTTNTRWKTVGKTSFLFTKKGVHRQMANGSFFDIPNDQAVLDIITDEDGQIWTAEGANGGVKLYPNADAIGKKPAQTLIKNIFPVTFLRDRDGGYWVTTIEQGVFYLRNKKVQIFDTQNAHFPFDVVSNTVSLGNHKVFVTFWQGEVGLFDTKTMVYKTIDRFSEGNIFDMKWQNAPQKLYIAGTIQLHIWQQGHITNFEGITPRKIALRPHQDGLWSVGYSGLREIIGTRTQDRICLNGGEVQNRIFSVFEDSQNRLWVSKQDGLYRLENDSLVAIPLLHIALKTRVEDIAELPDGNLVFATKGNGLVIYDGKKALNITKADGLVTDMLENVATDAKGNIWVGTMAGLNKLSPKPNGSGWYIQPITMFHGLPSNEINDISPSTEGVFLATPKGLVFYKDTPTDMPTPAPFLMFFKITSGNRDLSKNLAVKASENEIEIVWNCINFQMSSKIPYRYRLDSTDEWRFTFNRNIQYSSIFQGNYFFEVQAQNENGIWSDSLKLPFTVLPFWFETWWFRSSLALAVLVTAFLFYKKRIKNIKKEYDIALQINDLERSALATQMNPHFIFNCLNSIQLLIQRGEKNEAMTYLSRFAKMVRFTLESTRRGKVTIDEEVEALTNYLALEKLRFKEELDFTIIVDESVDSFSTEIPAMLIQPFVENALKHGFDSLEQAAKLAIHFTAENTFLNIEIQDNGRGFDPKSLLNSVLNAQNGTQNGKDISNHDSFGTEGRLKRGKTGVGIGLSRQRLALHNGQNASDDLLIEPILGDNDQMLGTSVRLKIRML